ncbi:MAG: glycosyltransferase family 9 protein [Candidatus Omnitrophica bacterium]|nr:glycosyltransferase family 9 protein [Candidatus Omnitrophota bacterium]
MPLMKLSNTHKILFITLSNIGDAILTLPVLSALKDNFPEASIDVVVGPRPQEVFKKDPRVNRVFIYDKHAGLKDKITFIKKLKAEKYDLAIDMKTSFLPVLIGAKHRSALLPVARSGIRHKRLIHLESLRPFELIYKQQKNIYIDDKARKKIEDILQTSGIKNTDIIIGVCPGSKSHLKQWKRQGFADVINSIMKNLQYKVILIGDTKEAGLSKEIAARIKQPGLIDLTGKTSLNELFALVEKFNLLLTGDSAGMHIASDLGVKVVAIFGPTDPEEYGPRGKEDIVIRKDLKCSPCKKAQCKFGTHECMAAISAEEVLEAIRRSI